MKLCDWASEGGLEEAIDNVTETVRSQPDDPGLRMALFELLCFNGDLERAGRQLSILGKRHPDLGIAAIHLQGLVAAEKQRRSVLTGAEDPRFIGEKPAWAPLQCELLVRASRNEDCSRFVGRPEMEYTGFAGVRLLESKDKKLREPFTAIRDGDDLLAPIVEVILNYRYGWIPWERVRRLEVEMPVNQRDLCWVSGSIETVAEERSEVYFPAIGFDSYESNDDDLRLARVAAWEERAGLLRNLGGKILLIDEVPVPLVELGVIEMSRRASAAGPDMADRSELREGG